MIQINMVIRKETADTVNSTIPGPAFCYNTT